MTEVTQQPELPEADALDDGIVIVQVIIMLEVDDELDETDVVVIPKAMDEIDEYDYIDIEEVDDELDIEEGEHEVLDDEIDDAVVTELHEQMLQLVEADDDEVLVILVVHEHELVE